MILILFPAAPSARLRRSVLAMLDAAAWAMAFALTAGLVRTGSVAAWLLPCAAAVAVQLGAGFGSGLYRGRASIGSAEQALLLATVVLPAGMAALLADLTFGGVLGGPGVPPVGIVMATLLALLVTGAGRLVIRQTLVERRPAPVTGARRVLVFGAGDAGQQLIRSMIVTAHLDRGGGRRPGDLVPVGILDDDRSRRRLRVLGVPVLGTRVDLARVARETGATMLVLAIPTAGAALVRQLAADAASAGLSVQLLPKLGELDSPDSVGVGDLRDLEMADLLGRHQIDTDVASIAGYLAGKRVLVTGAGGSIGSELCRQIDRFAPAELIMLDRDESALHAIQLSLYGVAALDAATVVLADIRDSHHLHRVFADRRPEVVFHAAALKHLTMLEQYPGEAVKTNVRGTATVLEAAMSAGVGRFVNISTDKAANPCSVLGYTKRLAEGLTAAAASVADGTYLSVRFGNVLGSRGSVVTTFTAQIAAGGPVTVTDPDVTRYFMTVREAVQLVIQAAAIGRDGEALVLDMGLPVRIDDVARQLIEMSGHEVDVVYTGLHPGEKLHEELFGSGEADSRPIHALVSHVDVPRVDLVSVLAIDPYGTSPSLHSELASRCGAMLIDEPIGVSR